MIAAVIGSVVIVVVAAIGVWSVWDELSELW